MKNLEKSLKVLANRRRLEVLAFLKKRREASVRQIAREINLSIKSTSKHLSILSAADMLEKDQRGLNVFYRLAVKFKPEVRYIINLL